MADFLVVGGRRCGTSFLYYLLRRFDRIWVPPIRELHYFDRPYEGTEWLQIVDQKQMWRDDLKAVTAEAKGLDEYAWALRYFLMPRSDRWYGGLFEARVCRGRITGEVAPDYALLPRDGIEHVKRVCPDAHIVFLLRDPAERTWSQMKAVQGDGQSLADMSDRDVAKLSLRPDIELRSQYRMQIENYQAVFGDDKVHVVFFEHLTRTPLTTVEQMSRHVGAGTDTDSFAQAGIEDIGRRNATQEGEMPSWLGDLLIKRYRDNVRWLADHVGNVPPAWQW